MGYGEGGGETKRQTDAGDPKALAIDHSQDVFVLCAERHPNADLICFPADHVGEHTVNTDDGEDEPDRSHYAGQRRGDLKDEQAMWP
jgi:hypothetical protein